MEIFHILPFFPIKTTGESLLAGVSTDAFSQCITDSLDVALEEVEHAGSAQ
jgi:hypothetical protein